MAAESSSSRSGGGGASADSYLGSLISLTSKCEIRYEGILYDINTEESSIGLRNVRSFGTEGRKKDGPQIPASDRIYEYILFRGSDIKDLQVKSSPPVPSAPLHNDPAIIQSHYSRPASLYASLPSTGSGTAADLTSQTAQLGLQQSTFQGGLPLYQPGGGLGSWGSSPAAPTVNGSGLAMPMYWQGYYAPSSGLPPMQQPPLLRPPPGLTIPHSIQQPLQYPIMNTALPTGSPNLPDFPSILPPVSNTMNLSSTLLPSTLIPTQGSAAALETSSLMPNKPSATTVPAASLGSDLTFMAPVSSNLESVGTMSRSVASLVSSNPRTASGQTLSYQTMNQSMSSIVGSSNVGQIETSVLLVTPDQLLQPGPATLCSSQPSQVSQKDTEIIPTAAKVKPLLPESSVLSSTEKKEPILPLPTPTDKKLNGSTLHNHHSNRDRGRGRGHGHQRPITRFTEDFDFTAMNEKFKKDEVWGHLGRSKTQSKDKEGVAKDDEDDDALEEDEAESRKFEIKNAVYVKDDFFDSLSCNTLDHGLQNGRTKFSEQLKIDTETFGDFPRYRQNRGGGRGFRGGGGGGRGRRGRGSYYSRGYGYAGRGDGHTLSNRGP